MSRPSYCPNCGSSLPKGSHGAQPFSRTEADDSEGGWDCYCDTCKWSGDILPDNETATTIQEVLNEQH